MAYYYLLSEDGNDIICMDAEKQATVTRNNTASTSSVMSGDNVTDGYEIGNRTIQINGIISYNKMPRQDIRGNPNPIEFQRRVDELIFSKKRFTLFSDKRGVEIFDDIDECIIQSVSVSSRDLTSVSASMTIKEIFVTDSAQVTYLPPQLSESSKANLAPRNDQGKGTSTEVKEETKKTLARKIQDGETVFGIDF